MKSLGRHYRNIPVASLPPGCTLFDGFGVEFCLFLRNYECDLFNLMKSYCCFP
ncbi:hypothetical protein Hanom_Chr08g00759201 [Helianthus anomalus]